MTNFWVVAAGTITSVVMAVVFVVALVIGQAGTWYLTAWAVLSLVNAVLSLGIYIGSKRGHLNAI